MRRTTIGILALSLIALAACGSPSVRTVENKPRPPQPVNVTVYINDRQVSLAPVSVGAGPVAFTVTNQASSAESLTILPAGGSADQSLAKTGPISPQATAQLTVDLKTSGDYTVATGPAGSSQAALATPSSIAPASLHVGPPRPSSSNQLLQP